MQLKGRLALIAKKVPKCSVVADIGSDHAYIPLYLIKQGICDKAIATDVKKGPIEIVRKNINKFNLQNSIEARLGNGLDVIASNECEVIVIAGMGGLLIKEILKRGMMQAKAAKALIIQPMNSIPELRAWLLNNGFDIFDEELAEEGEKIYNVLCVRWVGVFRNFDELSCLIGDKLIQRQDSLLKKYIQRQIDILEKALVQMKNIEKARGNIDNEYVLKMQKLKSILKNIN